MKKQIFLVIDGYPSTLSEFVEANRDSDTALTQPDKKRVKSLEIGQSCKVGSSTVRRVEEPGKAKRVYSYKLVYTTNSLREIENGTIPFNSGNNLKSLFFKLTNEVALDIVPASKSHTGTILVVGETRTLMVQP